MPQIWEHAFYVASLGDLQGEAFTGEGKPPQESPDEIKQHPAVIHVILLATLLQHLICDARYSKFMEHRFIKVWEIVTKPKKAQTKLASSWKTSLSSYHLHCSSWHSYVFFFVSYCPPFIMFWYYLFFLKTILTMIFNYFFL